MLALLLTFSLFVFLVFLGKAVLELLGLRFPILRTWLLAPCVGLATVLLLVLNLNEAGLPIKSIGPFLTVILSLLIVVVFRWKRPIIPWKQLGPFLGIAFLSLLYTCWPMYLYGFRWVGYMNGDMGTYCLGALRALNNGFYRIPQFQELAGTDYSQYWWFHYGPGLYRCGSDIFMAWLVSITRLTPLQVSMVVLGALNLAQLFTGASLILARPANRKLALSTSALLAFSPFFILGVILQVLGQVGGLTLVLGLCTLCMRSFTPDHGWGTLLKDAFLIACVASALCVYYPEAFPFAALAIAGYQGYQLLRRKQQLYPLAISLGCSLVLLLAVARQHIFTAIGTVLFTFTASVKLGVAQVIFTDFDTMLQPSLFASIFGFQIYYGRHADPWMSITIVAGMLLLVFCVISGLRGALGGRPWAFLLLVMVAVGLQLFFSNSAFGLFKLVMFMQPVLFVPLGAAVLTLSGYKRYLLPVAYLAFTCASARLYIIKSTDLVPGVTTSISLPAIENYDVRVPKITPTDAILIDSPNEVGDYVAAAAGIGTDIQWTSSDYFSGFVHPMIQHSILSMPPRLDLMRNYLPIVRSLGIRIDSRRVHEDILGHSAWLVGYRTGIAYLGHAAPNSWHSCSDDTDRKISSDYLVFHKLQNVHNYLSLISSDKGGPIYGSGTPSRWGLEADWYRPGVPGYAIGRYLLFEVIRPTPGMRLRVAITRGLMGRGRTVLPTAATINGDGTQTLPFTGAGAANVISQPIQLHWSHGRAYFAFDAGIPGERFPDEKTGLMRLFNSDFPLDQREVVGFARSIVAVTEPEYASLGRPRSIASWPDDLLKSPGLEFSGIYEDGWVSDNAYVILGKAAVGEKLLISGVVPGFGAFAKKGNCLEVLLNGKTIYKRELSPGPFAIEHTLTEDASQCRVSLLFNQMERLPSGDDRPVAAQLSRVSIVEAPLSNREGILVK